MFPSPLPNAQRKGGLALKTNSVIILVLIFQLQAVSSFGQAKMNPNCLLNEPCKALFDQAQQQSKSGNLPEAERSYRLAYAAEPDPALLFSIARVLHKQGLKDEAALYYQRFLDSSFDEPTQKQKAREYLEQTRPPARTSTVPVYKKWWFWTLVGVGTIGAAAAITAGVLNTKQDSQLPEFYPFR